MPAVMEPGVRAAPAVPTAEALPEVLRALVSEPVSAAAPDATAPVVAAAALEAEAVVIETAAAVAVAALDLRARSFLLRGMGVGRERQAATGPLSSLSIHNPFASAQRHVRA